MAEESESSGIAPYPLAMVVCDAIWKDPGSSKHTLLGTFTEVYAKSFPAVHKNMAVYIELTDGHGNVPFNIAIVDAEEIRPEVFKLAGDAEFGDPRGVLQIAFNFPPLEFPEPGEYRVQFFAANQFLIERRIMLRNAPNSGEQGNHP